jgi:hypothetical protein
MSWVVRTFRRAEAEQLSHSVDAAMTTLAW